MDWKKVVEFAAELQSQNEQIRQLDLRGEAARRAADNLAREEIRKAREEKEADLQWKREMLKETQHSNKQLAELNQQMSEKLSQMNTTLDFMLNAIGCSFQRLERIQQLTDRDVQQVLQYIKDNDARGFRGFVEAHGADAIQIILSCISMYLQR